MLTTGHPLVAIIQFSGSYINFFKRLPFFKEKFDESVKSSFYLVDFFKQKVAEYKVGLGFDGDLFEVIGKKVAFDCVEFILMFVAFIVMSFLTVSRF